MRVFFAWALLIAAFIFITRPPVKPIAAQLRESPNRSLVEFKTGEVWLVMHTSDDSPHNFDIASAPGIEWKRSDAAEMLEKGAVKVVTQNDYDYRLLAAKFLAQR